MKRLITLCAIALTLACAAPVGARTATDWQVWFSVPSPVTHGFTASFVATGPTPGEAMDRALTAAEGAGWDMMAARIWESQHAYPATPPGVTYTATLYVDGPPDAPRLAEALNAG